MEGGTAPLVAVVDTGISTLDRRAGRIAARIGNLSSQNDESGARLTVFVAVQM